MAETLFKAIDSVLQQTYQNLELLVLDDGSTDGSVQIATRFDDTRIKVLKGEHGVIRLLQKQGFKVEPVR